VVPEHQQVTLALAAGGAVATADEPPIALGQLPPAFLAGPAADKLKPGRLLRFSIREGGIALHEGRPVGAALHYEGTANQRRGRADLFSKIMFQHNARRQALTFERLLESAYESGGGGEEMADGGQGGGQGADGGIGAAADADMEAG
jgi:snurportin-1